MVYAVWVGLHRDPTMASSGCVLSLWLNGVLQCLLMFVDWMEYGHRGVPSLQEDNAESLVRLCSTVFADAYRLGGIWALWGPLPAGG